MRKVPNWITQKEIVKEQPTTLRLRLGVGIIVLMFVLIGFLGVYFYPACSEQELLFFDRVFNSTFAPK